MKINRFGDSKFTGRAVVTIGTFDGVHIGHQKIIKRLVKLARKKDMQAIVLTFFPHPRMVLQKDTGLKLINTIEEKSELLENLGVDQLVVQEFTADFSRLTALEFVRDILVNKLGAKYIIIGYDHRFGRNRAANIEDLREFGETYNFKVVEISAQEVNEVAVSSTKIRGTLSNGEIKTANAFLGYHYFLSGKVVEGKGLGQQIDFPTANLNIDADYKLVPKDGAYVVKSVIDGKEYFGMMNIGRNPTVSNEIDRKIEIHFFDWNKPMYGWNLKVELLHRIRDERKFESVEALRKQLFHDKEQILRFIADHYA